MSDDFNFHGNRIQTITIHHSRRSERRDVLVSGRVTPTQRAELEEISDQCGLSMSEVVNQAVTLFTAFWPHITELTENRDEIIELIRTI